MASMLPFALALAALGWGWFVHGLTAGYLTLPIVGELAAAAIGFATMIIGGIIGVFLVLGVDSFFSFWKSNIKTKVIGAIISVLGLSATMFGLWFVCTPTFTITILSVVFLEIIIIIEALTIAIIGALLYCV